MTPRCAQPAMVQISTSDFKVTKIEAALTPIVRYLRPQLGRPVRILNITGIRALESPSRAGRPVLSTGTSNGYRHIDNWLPVHHLSTAQVRAIVDGSRIRHHWAYDSEPGAGDWEGVSRLSCSECILGNQRDCILAARRRPRLAQLYAETEAAIGHDFKEAMSMRRVLSLARQPGGPQPGVVLDENHAEFDALERAVRAQLAKPIHLRASTEFTPVPVGCLSCAWH
jgi:3'-phosphoadenosine 5'-phosphosulfate sulfotransferase (PAPS reductase)/FAD synthetase